MEYNKYNFDKEQTKEIIEKYYKEVENRDITFNVSVGKVRGQKPHMGLSYALNYVVSETIQKPTGEIIVETHTISLDTMKKIFIETLKENGIEVNKIEPHTIYLNNNLYFTGIDAWGIEINLEQQKLL